MSSNNVLLVLKPNIMDGTNKIGGGVLLSSALAASGSGSGGQTNSVNLVLGPTGDSQRNWRLQISPLINDKNALFIQYLDKSGNWQTGNVVLARE